MTVMVQTTTNYNAVGKIVSVIVFRVPVEDKMTPTDGQIVGTTKDESYLGDGLEAVFDGWRIQLRAMRDGPITHYVFLEPETYLALVAFAAHINQKYRVNHFKAYHPTESDVLHDMQRYIIKLEEENWGLKQACGYPIPAHKEIIDNPWQCGMCQAKNIEINELTRRLEDRKP